jgi:hypothetical protein
MSMESHGGMISTGEHSSFFHQRSLTILSVDSSISKAGRTGEANDGFGLEVSLFTLRRVL